MWRTSGARRTAHAHGHGLHRHRHPHPVKRRPGSELAQEHLAYNAAQTALRAIGERGNSLLKTTFKALRHVSLDPSRIGDITAAALTTLHLRDRRTT